MDFTFFDAWGLIYVYSVINIKAIWDKLKLKTDDYCAVQTDNLQRGLYALLERCPDCQRTTGTKYIESLRGGERRRWWPSLLVYYAAPSIEQKVGLNGKLQFVPRMAMPVWFASRLNDIIITITTTAVFLNRKVKSFEQRQCVHPITILVNLLFNFYGSASLKACHCGTRGANLKNSLDK